MLGGKAGVITETRMLRLNSLVLYVIVLEWSKTQTMTVSHSITVYYISISTLYYVNLLLILML